MAVIPARRYATAGTSHGPVSVCLSASVVIFISQRMVAVWSFIETAEQFELLFGTGASSAHPTLC